MALIIHFKMAIHRSKIWCNCNSLNILLRHGSFLKIIFQWKKWESLFFAILFWTEHEKNLQKKKGEELPDDAFLFLHFFFWRLMTGRPSKGRGVPLINNQRRPKRDHQTDHQRPHFPPPHPHPPTHPPTNEKPRKFPAQKHQKICKKWSFRCQHFTRGCLCGPITQ